jgi:hypothetical protein
VHHRGRFQPPAPGQAGPPHDPGRRRRTHADGPRTSSAGGGAP